MSVEIDNELNEAYCGRAEVAEVAEDVSTG